MKTTAASQSRFANKPSFAAPTRTFTPVGNAAQKSRCPHYTARQGWGRDMGWISSRGRASCSALDKGNASLRQTSSVTICTRPLRNWATSIRSPELIKPETMRSVVLETRTCETMRNVPRAYTSTGWAMLERT